MHGHAFRATIDARLISPFEWQSMERYFMSRTSAVALLVDARRAITQQREDKFAHDASHYERLLGEVERLLLDVRVGRVLEFDLEFPSPVHVIVAD
jgi:hypothetical protein